jgi:pyruvate formate lyase activating enzyme
MREIEKDRIFYDLSGGGATFSGGEPLMQPDFLVGLLRSCRRRGIHTAVDTSGYADWAVLNGIRSFTDLFLYDLKIMNPDLHRRFTGRDNLPILDNLQRLDAAGARILIRVPVIPGINDSRANIEMIGRFLAGLHSVRRLDLLPYNALCREKYRWLKRPYRFNRLKPPSGGSMERIRRRLSAFGLDVGMGG